jgi:hypothetical protein
MQSAAPKARSGKIPQSALMPGCPADAMPGKLIPEAQFLDGLNVYLKTLSQTPNDFPEISEI